MTHDELVEKVARALTTGTPNATDLRLARAALAAIREAAEGFVPLHDAADAIDYAHYNEGHGQPHILEVAALLRALAGEAGDAER